MSLDVDLYYVCDENKVYVYSANITHNITKIANHVGAYKCVWRPDEAGIMKAKELIKPLEDAIAALNDRQLDRFNPSNGWGSREGFIEFLSDYLEACKLYPNSLIDVSR